jgi:uncharacterized tellurite resistance protein B-like protein
MDAAVASELLKLLLQVAWSDLTLSSQEIVVVLEAAKRWGVPEKEAIDLVGALADRRALPAPDLGVLRAHREEVREKVMEIAAADGFVVADEEEMLAEIERLLAPATE